MIRAAAHTHRGLARVPVVPYRAHAVILAASAACIAARGAAIAAARARTVSDVGFVRAVSTIRTRAAIVIVPRSAHTGAHIRAARATRGMIRAAAHTHRGLARVPVVPYRAHAVITRRAACIAHRGLPYRAVVPLLPQLVHAPSPMAALYVPSAQSVHVPPTSWCPHPCCSAHTGCSHPPVLPLPQLVHAARATRGMIRAAAHTHRGLARVPVVPYRAHAVIRVAVLPVCRPCTCHRLRWRLCSSCRQSVAHTGDCSVRTRRHHSSCACTPPLPQLVQPSPMAALYVPSAQYTCRHRHSAPQCTRRSSHPCCPCHSWYDPRRSSHTPGTGSCPGSTLPRTRSHHSSCCLYCRPWCRYCHSSCTSPMAALYVAVSTIRTRAANVIVPRSAHARAHIRAARATRGMIRAAHTHTRDWLVSR